VFDFFKKEEINALKSKIAVLEEENRKLSLQLEKKDEKTKKTIAIKQDVDKELNEAQSKISSLENVILKLKKETSSAFKYRFSESISRNRLEEIMFLLASIQSKNPSLITIYLAKDATLKDASKEFVDKIDASSQYLIEKIESSNGKIIFYDTNQMIKLLVIPFLPVSKSLYSLERQFQLEPLKKNLEYDKILVINAHAGETLAGIVERDSFVEQEFIRSSVMGKHKQGGWSQKRFQSLVEEDVRHHADKVKEALRQMIEKNKDIQYIIAGGEAKLIKMILEGVDYPLILKSMDAISKGNAEQALKDVFGVRWYGI